MIVQPISITYNGSRYETRHEWPDFTPPQSGKEGCPTGRREIPSDRPRRRGKELARRLDFEAA